MPLEAGTRLGPYEILAPIGAGGMGEVYRAKDTRLDRTVAIKVLPEDFAAIPERKQRFEREAKAISQLNHPHICTLHDVHLRQGYGAQVGEAGDVDYMVMEHIEGETLAHRLEKGALPLDQALEYGIQIADGLDTAHRAGIAHRDLKPGNVMLTSSGVKLLDFGLAKLVSEQAASADSDAPTRQQNLTGEQSILGTLQYMAPEQLEGKTIDTRADVWAFGALLYEMLTGQKAFEGNSQASLIAAIMEHEPVPVSRLQALTPPALERVVQKCLKKYPDKRWQSATDLRDELSWIAGGGGQTRASASTSSQGWLSVAAAALVAATAAALVVGSLPRPSNTPTEVTRFTIRLEGYIHEDRSNVALAPDGRSIAYVSDKDGTRKIYSRDFEQLEPEAIAGTEGAAQPFFSPDGQRVGFGENEVKTIPVSGGTATTLADTSMLAASWVVEDTVLVERFSDGTNITMIPASGGAAKDASTLHPDEGETDHRTPEMLPGGHAFLFNVEYGRGENRIFAQSLETGERRDLLEGTWPRYSPTGHIVFARSTGLWAAPFDVDRLELTGAAVPVLENVRGLNLTGQFALGRNGTLVYVASGGRKMRTLVWVDRQGNEERLPTEPALYNRPKLSPDGRHIAIEMESDLEIWLYEVSTGSPKRLTFDPALDLYPMWTKDGERVVFSSGRGGVRNLFWRAVDGTGQVERLTTSENLQSPWSWSADGDTLVFQERDAATGWGIGAISLASGRQRTSLYIQGLSADVSPDGKWIAYSTFGSGTSRTAEVLVRPFPNVEDGGQWQISRGGGFEPRWTRDGRELIYLTLSDLVSVRVEEGPAFHYGSPQTLFSGDYFFDGGGRSYDISPDGTRFLMIKELEEGAPTELVVVLNWHEELKRLAPADN